MALFPFPSVYWLGQMPLYVVFFGSELHYNAVCCICSNEYGMTNIQQNQARESRLDMKLYHDISINVVFLGGGRFFPCYNLYIV